MLSRADVDTIMVDGMGKEYLIMKVNKVNSSVIRLNDGKEGNIPTAFNLKFLRYPTAADRSLNPRNTRPTVQRDAAIRPGAIVTLKSIRGLEKAGITTSTKCVVLKINQKTISVVELGGRRDGMFYQVPESGLIPSTL